MSDQMVSEHFSFTPAIKLHIKKEFEEIREFLPKGSACKIAVDHEPHRHFSAKIRTRAFHHDLLAKTSDQDLYVAISRSAEKLIHSLITLRKRRLDKRRKPSGVDFALIH